MSEEDSIAHIHTQDLLLELTGQVPAARPLQSHPHTVPGPRCDSVIGCL